MNAGDEPAGHSSAAGRAFVMLRARFRTGRAAIPYAAWVSWLKTLGVGAVGLLALTVGLIQMARELLEAGHLDWEHGFMYWLAEEGPFDFSTAVFYQTFGADVTLMFVMAAAIALAIWLYRPMTALSIALAPIVMDWATRFGWMWWDRARPDILWDGIAAPSLHSFPSGHAGKSFAVYGLLTWLWLRASGSVVERVLAVALLLLIAVVVSLGRLTMGVHWPSDVIAGVILGAVWAAVLAYALRFESASDAAR